MHFCFEGPKNPAWHFCCEGPERPFYIFAVRGLRVFIQILL